MMQTKGRILIVEDDFIIAADIKHTLEGHGYAVAGIAPNTEKTLQLVKSERPGLVLMDIHLEGNDDGIFTARELQKVRRTPVIVLSAFSDAETLRRIQRVHPSGYLVKPFEAPELITAIDIAFREEKLFKREKAFQELLEKRVRERTSELEALNREMIQEIERRKLLEAEKDKALIDLNLRMKELASLNYSAQIFKSEMLRSQLEQEHVLESKHRVFEALRNKLSEMTLIRDISSMMDDSSAPFEEALLTAVKSINEHLNHKQIQSVRLICGDSMWDSPDFQDTGIKKTNAFELSTGNRGELEFYLQSGFEDDDDWEILHSLTAILKNFMERHHTRSLLTEQMKLLQEIIDVLPAPVFYKNFEGIYLGCNRAFCDLLGLPIEEIVGHRVAEVWPRKLAEHYRDMDKKLFSNPGVQVYEAKLMRSDGEERKVIFHKATFPSSEGNIAGLVGVIEDITDFRNREESFIARLAVFQEILDGAGIHQIRFDPLGNPVWWSKGLAAFLGLKNHRGGMNLKDYHPELHQKLLNIPSNLDFQQIVLAGKKKIYVKKLHLLGNESLVLLTHLAL